MAGFDHVDVAVEVDRGSGPTAFETGDDVGARIAIVVARRAVSPDVGNIEVAGGEPVADEFSAWRVGVARRVDCRHRHKRFGKIDHIVAAIRNRLPQPVVQSLRSRRSRAKLSVDALNVKAVGEDKMEPQVIVAHRLARSAIPALNGLSEDEGYAIQAAANQDLEAHLGPRVGYKIGATTEAMRQLLRVKEPVAGEVFASTVLENDAVLGLNRFVSPGIETEIAVRLEAEVPESHAPYDRESIAGYVDYVMPSIEIVDNRYEEIATAGAATFAADNNFNAAIVLGDPILAWRDLALEGLQARTIIDDRVVATGESSALMGHPLDALAWLANRYARLGRNLQPGWFVTLGTITPVQWIERPCDVRIEIEEIGALNLRWMEQT